MEGICRPVQPSDPPIARKAPTGIISRVQFSQAGGGRTLLPARFMASKRIPQAGPANTWEKFRGRNRRCHFGC